MIESRNLKKTRIFYHKLIQQERKNKGVKNFNHKKKCNNAVIYFSNMKLVCFYVGSEAKVMLSKLRAQFDELRTKVEFLGSVRQYLKVGSYRFLVKWFHC